MLVAVRLMLLLLLLEPSIEAFNAALILLDEGKPELGRL
jgi:hypothetical protein